MCVLPWRTHCLSGFGGAKILHECFDWSLLDLFNARLPRHSEAIDPDDSTLFAQLLAVQGEALGHLNI